MAIGGKDKSGGVGGAVTLCGAIGATPSCSGAAWIVTAGDQSPGLMLQSVGGGGGQGGAAVTRSAAAIFSASLALGGQGGPGGAAGNVNASNISTIQTGGVDSIGLLAQSIGGGGGGDGGSFAKAWAANINEIPGAVSFSFGMGGTGGSGGGGVSIGNHAPIGTLDDGSMAILAQSIAGGRGNGGGSTAASTVIPGGGANLTISVALGGRPGSARAGARWASPISAG